MTGTVISMPEIIANAQARTRCKRNRYGPLADLAGLEPTTRCLEGSCSVQMSYRSKVFGILYHSARDAVKPHVRLSQISALRTQPSVGNPS